MVLNFIRNYKLSDYNKQGTIALLILSIIYIIVNSYFTYNNNLYFNLVPAFLLIVFLALFALDKLLLLVVFFVPIAVSLRDFYPRVPNDISLPTEPILFGILLIFIIKFLFGQKIDRKIIYHPVSLAIYFYLFWMGMTTLTSTMPMVSVKAMLVRLWFIVPFYFLATQVFERRKNIYRYIWLYVIPLVCIIVYVISRHLKFGLLDNKAPTWAVWPFFNDHTAYGAILAFFVPVLAGFAFSKRYHWNIKFFIWIVIFILIFAVIFSYSRAAWLSLLAAAAVGAILKFNIKLKYIFLASIIAGTYYFYNKTDIMFTLKRNKQDASKDLAQHFQSISNVTSDASNLERLNRWHCAMKMFAQKPVFGWGIGTYQFKYAPFQKSEDMTIISTNAGDMGTAHSEYIGPLAEMGVLGALAFVGIIVATIYTGFKVYKRTQSREVKILAVVVLMGLITYYFHGSLNNFLDTDKAACLFWGFTAMLVALDVFHTKTIDN